MDIKAINQAIDKTALRGRLSAENLERWRQSDKLTKGVPPMWLSVLIGMAASLDLSLEETNSILLVAMPKDKLRPVQKSIEQIEVDPGVILEPSLAADSALRRGKTEEAQTLWLEVLSNALEAHMTTAEPYRMFGNLASTAFVNGELILAEAALDIALKLNSNYSLGRSLSERNANGEYLQYSMKRLIDSPPPKFVSKSDLEMESNTEILAKLADFGINLSIEEFIKIAHPVKDTIEKVVDQVEALADSKVRVEGRDDDYIYAACEVLWDRLITRPLFGTFQDILFDLEDSEDDSNLYFDSIKKLSWAFESTDQAVLAYYQSYPFELGALRYVMHDLLSYEILRDSSVAQPMLSIAHNALKSSYFPDMQVVDIVQRIHQGTNWHAQLNNLLKSCPEYSQVIIAGLARGLSSIDNSQDVIDICAPIWGEVLNGSAAPEDPEILSIGDYLEEAYSSLGHKSDAKQINKERIKVITIINEAESAASKMQESKFRITSYDVLKDSGRYPELFAYEEFLQSLGISFETAEPTIDKTRLFSTDPNHKVGRNDPCPCGALKPDGTPVKYKKCHGR